MLRVSYVIVCATLPLSCTIIAMPSVCLKIQAMPHSNITQYCLLALITFEDCLI